MHRAAFKLCCRNMKCCRTQRRQQEKLGEPNTTARSRSWVLLTWLVSNFYRPMGRNGHVFALRLHKFWCESDRWRPWKSSCSPCSLTQRANQEIKADSASACWRLWMWMEWSFSETISLQKTLEANSTWAEKQAELEDMKPNGYLPPRSHTHSKHLCFPASSVASY